jgi:hypothetical protein
MFSSKVFWRNTMIALRVLGIASAITFIASAVVAQTAITREKPLIANPTIIKPIVANPKPVVANPTIAKPQVGNPTVNPVVNPGRIRADDDASSHLSSPGEAIKGSFGENSAWQKTGTRAAGRLNTVNPADVKMNTMKPGMQQQSAPAMQRAQ